MRAVGRHFEQDRVAWNGTGADTPQEPTARHLVELGDAVGQLRGIVVRDAAHASGELDPLRV